MTATKIAHPDVEERQAHGRAALDRTPPSSHSGRAPAAGRPDPVTLLEKQNTTREPDLMPVRHGRMMVSPFTFYRAAVTIMALRDWECSRRGRVSAMAGRHARRPAIRTRAREWIGVHA